MSSHDPSPEVRAVHQVGALAGHHAGQGASARIGAGHGHEHASTEGFPRFEVRDLIGDSLAATRQRELWQDAVVTLGLCLVALALPTYRLLGDGPSLVSTTARGSWSSLHLGLQPFAQLISKLPSIGPERAWFLIAAVCWSATYPVLSRMNLALGMSRLASCTSALLVLAAPLSFLSATLPGPSAPALLGSAILFSSLLTSANRGANAKRSTGPLGTWFAVCLLDPNLVMTLPAVIWHSFSMPDGRPTPWPARWRTILGATTGLLVLTALGMAATVPTLAGSSLASVWRAFGWKLLGAGSAGAPDSLTFLFVLAPALGVGILGIGELLRRPAEPTESPAPAWILAFLGVPIAVKLLGGTPSLDTGAWVLGPLIAVGLAVFLSRMREDRRLRVILALTGVQLAFSGVFRFTVERGDPNQGWNRSAAEMLEPSDLVMTRDQKHDYLLLNRFHVRTVNLRGPVELDELARDDWWAAARENVRAQARAGGRVVVDWKVGEPTGGNRGYAFQQDLHELVLLAPVIHLDPRGERRDSLEDLPQPTVGEGR